MKRLGKIWNDYWFRPAPLADLAIFRIIAAGGQLFNYLVIWRPIHRDFAALSEIPHLYDPLAVVRLFLRPMGPEWLPPLAFLTVLFWITVAALVLATLGLLTNASLTAAAAGGLFLQAYAYSFGDFHHPEALMALALVCLALSPCGRVLSLDAIRRRARTAVARRRWVAAPALDEMSAFARWPLRMLVALFALVYFSAAYHKYLTGGHAWMNGYTLQYYLLQDGLRWNRPMGMWLASHHGLAVVSSVVTMLFETFFFLAVFIPGLLLAAWPIGFGMHVGILVLMAAGFFEYLILYLALLPWTALFRWVRTRRGGSPRARLDILFDGACPLCLRSMSVLYGLDWFGRLRFLPFQEQAGARQAHAIGASPEDLRKELHLVGKGGKVWKGFFAFRAMSWHLPPAWPVAPFLYMPGMSVAGPIIYRWIADSRRRFTTCEAGACRI